MLRIAFTGHRKDKLNLYTHPQNELKICLELYKVLLGIIKDNQGCDFEFISGGAIGLDQIAFEVVNKIKVMNRDINITNVISIPFKNQYIVWSKEEQSRYFECLKLADEIIYVDTLEQYKIKGLIQGEYHPAKMQMRNRHMVDNCDILIALWDGSKGGTKNCINYAKKQKDVNIIYLDGIF